MPERLTPEQLQKVLFIDAEVPLGVLSMPVVTEIERLEPHGLANPRPLLLASQVRVVGEPRVVGEQKNHLQLHLVQGNSQLKAIGWNMAEKARDLTTSAVVLYCLPSQHQRMERPPRRTARAQRSGHRHRPGGICCE